MHFLDLTLPSPEANLACDEALMDAAEAGELPPSLRFWESAGFFIVLGHSNRVGQETDSESCRTHKVPILRRSSGGGTVLQGPGCLNYNLVLPIDARAEFATVTQTNAFIMNRHRMLFTRLLGQPVHVRGHTDLCLEHRKFSGNAQRRKRRHLLFHGTVLLDLNLPLLESCLRPPPRQPDYRQNRSHRDFLTSLPLDRERIKTALIEAWRANTPLPAIPQQRIEALTLQKYAAASWNDKFP